ncbi:hypothetical protein ACU4GI_25880 [Cupriavidus basilensis]
MYAAGKAGNADGVATGPRDFAECDAPGLATCRVRREAARDPKDLHANCIHLDRKNDGDINYVEAANFAGFVAVTDAMPAQALPARGNGPAPSVHQFGEGKTPLTQII